MCEITVTNLHDPILNERLWLLMGSLGSKDKHDDGWGVANQSGAMFKCGIPMHWSINAGEQISSVAKGSSMLLGHIRDASARVPVNDKNAHPFQLENITFVHNGKLTPKKEKDFVMDEKVPDIDSKTGKQCTDKDGNLLFKTVGRSDSLIFFEEFIKDWQACPDTYETQHEKFVAVVKATMSKFYGKFALVFIINGTFYICRGKTANLYISYLVKEAKKDAEVLGWAINTGLMTLDAGTTLLSNLNVIDGKSNLIFSYPELLEEESIFVADKYDVVKIGEMNENVAPVTTRAVYPHTQAHGGAASSGTNFTTSGGTTTTTGVTKKEPDELEQITSLIYNWMENYSLSPQDIQFMLYQCFSVSILDVSVDMLKYFYHNVLVKLSNRVEKKTRKNIRRTTHGYIGIYNYEGLAYPWMINSKDVQKKFIK